MGPGRAQVDQMGLGRAQVDQMGLGWGGLFQLENTSDKKYPEEGQTSTIAVDSPYYNVCFVSMRVFCSSPGTP